MIGSHCIALDYLLGELQRQGVRSKFLAVGSTAGLDAAKRGECDVAGVHLLDPKTNEYNRPFLTPELELVPGYGRLQGIVFRPGDERFEGRTAHEAIASAIDDPACMMVNRNQGSGTRALIDRLLGGAKPPGYAVQPRNHNAVAAAVVQGRADWGMTLDTIARSAGLGFLPVQAEQYDFIVPRGRANRPGVVAFKTLLAQASTREALVRLGMSAGGYVLAYQYFAAADRHVIAAVGPMSCSQHACGTVNPRDSRCRSSSRKMGGRPNPPLKNVPRSGGDCSPSNPTVPRRMPAASQDAAGVKAVPFRQSCRTRRSRRMILRPQSILAASCGPLHCLQDRRR